MRQVTPHAAGVDSGAHALSGGQGRKSRPRKNRRRAAQALRMAAQSVLRADCAFGACYRRRKGPRGPAPALVATAHKIARTVSPLLKDRVPYHALGAAADNKRCRERALQSLQKQAAQLGYTLSPA
jgi:transposase